MTIRKIKDTIKLIPGRLQQTSLRMRKAVRAIVASAPGIMRKSAKKGLRTAIMIVVLILPLFFIRLHNGETSDRIFTPPPPQIEGVQVAYIPETIEPTEIIVPPPVVSVAPSPEPTAVSLVETLISLVPEISPEPPEEVSDDDTAKQPETPLVESPADPSEEPPTQPPPYIPTRSSDGMSGGGTSTEGTKVAYLTIDDGPSRNITTGILDILQQEGIKATFFVLPYRDVEDIYWRIIDEGHEIGNHTYSHSYPKLYNPGSIEFFREDVIKAHDYIYGNYGYYMTSFRFPGGAMGRSSGIIGPRREFLAELGYTDFDWHVDSGDANSNMHDKSAQSLTRNVLEKTRGREKLIVLMHDTQGKTTTLEALPYIIAGLREQGYSFDILRNY